MVWVITVMVFLGTFIAGALILLLISQRDRIREALRTPNKEKRIESRTVSRVEVRLLSAAEPFIDEITSTENVSRSGARVVTKTKWPLKDRVTVKHLPDGLPNLARITYCKPLKEDAFAIGLQFSSPVVGLTAKTLKPFAAVSSSSH